MTLANGYIRESIGERCGVCAGWISAGENVRLIPVDRVGDDLNGKRKYRGWLKEHVNINDCKENPEGPGNLVKV